MSQPEINVYAALNSFSSRCSLVTVISIVTFWFPDGSVVYTEISNQTGHISD